MYSKSSLYDFTTIALNRNLRLYVNFGDIALKLSMPRYIMSIVLSLTKKRETMRPQNAKALTCQLATNQKWLPEPLPRGTTRQSYVSRHTRQCCRARYNCMTKINYERVRGNPPSKRKQVEKVPTNLSSRGKKASSNCSSAAAALAEHRHCKYVSHVVQVRFSTVAYSTRYRYR
jgi:hypothetical protein